MQNLKRLKIHLNKKLLIVMLLVAMGAFLLGQTKGAAIPTGVGIGTVSLSPSQNFLRPRAAGEANRLDGWPQAKPRRGQEAHARQIVIEFIERFYEKYYLDHHMARQIPGRPTPMIISGGQVKYGYVETTPVEVFEILDGFADIREGTRIFDFGHGDGLFDLLMAAKYGAFIDGAEEDLSVYKRYFIMRRGIARHFMYGHSEFPAEVIAMMMQTLGRVHLWRADIFFSKIMFQKYDKVYMAYPEPTDGEEEFLANLNRTLSDRVYGMSDNAELIIFRIGPRAPIELKNFKLVRSINFSIKSIVNIPEGTLYKYKLKTGAGYTPLAIPKPIPDRANTALSSVLRPRAADERDKNL